MPFKFDHIRLVHLYQNVTFQAKIGNCLHNIKTEVVDCKIQLMLSKESLFQAGAVIIIGKCSVKKLTFKLHPSVFKGNSVA